MGSPNSLPYDIREVKAMSGQVGVQQEQGEEGKKYETETTDQPLGAPNAFALTTVSSCPPPLSKIDTQEPKIQENKGQLTSHRRSTLIQFPRYITSTTRSRHNSSSYNPIKPESVQSY